MECKPLEVSLPPGESTESIIHRFKKAFRKSDTMLRIKEEKRHHLARAEARRVKREILQHLELGGRARLALGGRVLDAFLGLAADEAGRRC